MTNNKLTDELRGFYAAYSAWIKSGAQPDGVFNRNVGLCASAYDYFYAIRVDAELPLEVMHRAFVAAGLNEKLPFNETPEHYAMERAQDACHINPARLAWVAAELQEYRKAKPIGEVILVGPALMADFHDPVTPGDKLYASPQPAHVPQGGKAVQALTTEIMELVDRITGHRLSVAKMSELRPCIFEACRAAMQSGAVKDGWVACSERMPDRGVDVLVCKMTPFGAYDEIETAQWHGGMKVDQPVFITSADTIEPELWQPLPAAPQQEAE